MEGKQGELQSGFRVHRRALSIIIDENSLFSRFQNTFSLFFLNHMGFRISLLPSSI